MIRPVRNDLDEFPFSDSRGGAATKDDVKVSVALSCRTDVGSVVGKCVGRRRRPFRPGYDSFSFSIVDGHRFDIEFFPALDGKALDAFGTDEDVHESFNRLQLDR